MKELSIEEKAKAYDEALKKAQEAANNGYVSQNFVSDIFPELKESEDERIRKEMISWLKGFIGEEEGCGYTEDEIKERIAWLEKQGEHANFLSKIQAGDKVTRNEDGVLVNLSQLNRIAKKDEKQGEQKPILRDTFGYEEGRQFGKNEVLGNPEKFGLQKPAEWSEEDEDNLNSAIYYIRREPYRECDVEPVVDWLRNKFKSPRPQSTWKPSDEQMKTLKYACGGNYVNLGILDSLYQDLQKLREE